MRKQFVKTIEEILKTDAAPNTFGAAERPHSFLLAQAVRIVHRSDAPEGFFGKLREVALE